ncbi:MAG: O-antigen ligase family protein [Rhodothermales bacterium]
MPNTPLLPGDTWLLNWGRFLLGGALALGLLVTVYLTALAPDLLPALPILLLAGLAGWWLFTHPLANLFVVLCAFVLVASHEEGIQATEALYALYFLAFLGHWVVVHLFMRKDHVIRTREDQALILFLAFMTLSIPLTLVFGGSLKGALTEWLAYMLLGLYFPVRAAVQSSRRGVMVVLVGVAFVGFFVLIRNALNFQEIIVDATAPWQVARGRVITNSALILVPSFIALGLFLAARTVRELALWFGFFMMFVAGLLLTQSRGYWLAFAVGAFVIFLLVGAPSRRRLLWSGIVSLLGVVSVAYILFPDAFLLMATGMINRLFSIGSAISTDPSMVNRYLESQAAMEHVKSNPILGHGMGTPFRFYDITWEYSMNRAFIHNGYVSLLFKFGLWGTGLVLFFLGAIFVRSTQSFRRKLGSRTHQAMALGVAGCLAAFSILTITSNPFYLKDTLFILGVLSGIGGGAWALRMDS